MRPLMGIVSLNTFSSKAGRPECLMALIPRSESARLIDLVKFSGVVEGSRRSADERIRDLRM